MTKERIQYLDIARGFAILFMFTQHCMLVHEYGAGDSEHWLSVVFTLLGTAPAAPVFMIIMGAFLMESRASWRENILRGIKLFGLGLLLNLFRLPMLLPEGSVSPEYLRTLIFNILIFNDILQLAGLSFILGALLKRFMGNAVFPPVLITVILVVSPLLWGLFPENPVFFMLWGIRESINFPFFPWVVYPLTGMYLGRFLLRGEEMVDLYLNRLALAGAGLLIISGFLVVFDIFPLGDYSRSGLGIHLLILGVVFIWLKICRFMEKYGGPDSRIIHHLSFLSRNITLIYFLQWILFSWSTLIFGFNNQNPYTAAVIGLGVFIVTYTLARRRIIKKLFSFTKI